MEKKKKIIIKQKTSNILVLGENLALKLEELSSILNLNTKIKQSVDTNKGMGSRIIRV